VVTHGGKIVALSRTQGVIGPSLRRLSVAGDPKNAPAALRGHDADPDSVAGRRLAQVLAWADVYLYSGIDRQVVEDLSMVPIDHLDDATADGTEMHKMCCNTRCRVRCADQPFRSGPHHINNEINRRLC